MRGDIPIGRQLKRPPRLSLTTSTLSCNALDDRIAALENEIESGSSEESGEEASDREESEEEPLRTVTRVESSSSKTVHVVENIIAETDENGNVIRLKSSLSGTCCLSVILGRKRSQYLSCR